MKPLTDMQGAGLGQHRPEEGSRLRGEGSERSSGKAVSSLGWAGLLGKTSGLNSLSVHATPNTLLILSLICTLHV